MNKICTSIEQSKKLIELGIDRDTADMCWQNNEFPIGFNDDDAVPAWSLTALLDVLESEIDGEEGETYQLNIEKDGTWWYLWYKEKYDEANPIETESTEDLVDACIEIILKLHEQKLL